MTRYDSTVRVVANPSTAKPVSGGEARLPASKVPSGFCAATNGRAARSRSGIRSRQRCHVRASPHPPHRVTLLDHSWNRFVVVLQKTQKKARVLSG